MNKADIVAELSRRMDIDQNTATNALENILDIIVRSVERNESVTIMGFGTFERRDRAARVAGARRPCARPPRRRAPEPGCSPPRPRLRSGASR